MGLTLFTPALLMIGGVCVLALFITLLNCISIHGVKARMVTQAQQELFGDKLLKAIEQKLTESSTATARSIEDLSENYRAHVVEIAEVKASHAATVRQFDQMMASYTRLHQMLVARLLDMASGGKSHAAADLDSMPVS